MANLLYQDKVVIVTGGSSGIGKGCAQEFLRAGAEVVMCCNNESEGKTVVAALQETARAQGSGSATFIYCDVRNTDDIRNLIETTISRLGRIDCLINNAGWHPPHKPIDDFSVEEFRDLLNLNLVSIFTACKFALPTPSNSGQHHQHVEPGCQHRPASRHDLCRYQRPSLLLQSAGGG